jgi:radical SAM protein with 4Fe4S-binding SPASM domain
MKFKKGYDYNSPEPVKIGWDEMSERERHLLTDNKSFCMVPWIHLHAYPTGKAYPCCMGNMDHPVGDFKQQTIKEVWNSDKMKQMRTNMIEGKSCVECTKCYEQDDAGFLSMRKSMNKHFGHHIKKVVDTKEDGEFQYEGNMIYWDIRFSNLCNFSCRSCGTYFSSNWYDDHVKLHGSKPEHPKVVYAGQHKMDMWEQMKDMIPYIEQVYFAGGEPLIMEEHYLILKELIKHKRFDVRLIYNTNFSRMQYKDLDVIPLWKEFESVSIGASLDAMGPRAEYMRKGTQWDQTVRNRERMIEECPGVDFYISPTLSIYNSYHVLDFHKEWVRLGLIKHQDLNINILQNPDFLRIDVLPNPMKDELVRLYKEHIEWLRPHDRLKRAIQGYESAIKYMQSDSKVKQLSAFYWYNKRLDAIRGEGLYDVFPELKALKDYKPTKEELQKNEK